MLGEWDPYEGSDKIGPEPLKNPNNRLWWAYICKDSLQWLRFTLEKPKQRSRPPNDQPDSRRTHHKQVNNPINPELLCRLATIDSRMRWNLRVSVYFYIMSVLFVIPNIINFYISIYCIYRGCGCYTCEVGLWNRYYYIRSRYSRTTIMSFK